MKNLQWPIWVVGLGLQYMVIACIISGSLREFWPVLAYLLCLAITTITDIAFVMTGGEKTRLYAYYYWTAEFVRQTALYAVVISFVLRAMPSGERRNQLVRLLLVISIIFWVGSLAIQHDPYVTRWMVKVIRNLSFCSALVNLVLWFVLIAAPRKDSRLLMITGGLGIQMTGDAIGQSLRQLSVNLVTLGDLMLIGTHFVCLYTWWQAFQPDRSHSNQTSLSSGAV